MYRDIGMKKGIWREKKVGVFLGGISSERDVSLNTGNAIVKALRGKGYDVVEIDPDHDIAQTLQANPIDVACIALHGRYGEDGCIQGLLEWMKIPYTGSGVLSSALAMHKALAKKVFVDSGIPTPQSKEISSDQLDWDLEKLGMGAVVVKPSNEGSSVGIQVCKDDATLKAALEDAAKYDTSILVEQFIEGRELTVGVLNDQPLAVIEIIPAEEFYDFTAKYKSDQTQYLCPAPVSEEITAQALEHARAAYRTLGCRGVARVDFMLDQDGGLWVLEVNTIPGMTATSLVPKMAKQLDIDFADLCEMILDDASLQR